MSEQNPEQPARTGSTDETGAEHAIPWKLVLWATVGVYALAFLVLNNEKTSVSFVFFTVKTRLIWLVLLSMALGAALMLLAPRLWQRRRNRKAGG